MAHTIRDREKLLARIRRIKGQVAALETALGGEPECAAVLQQIAAIRGAASGLMTEVLEGHIRDHLGAAKTPPKERARDLDVVLRTVRSYLR